MNKPIVVSLAFNLFDEVKRSVDELYRQNKDFRHLIVDLSYPIHEDKLPDSIEESIRINTANLITLAKDYGAEYVKLENKGVSQNHTQVYEHLKPADDDVIVFCDVDEEPQEDGWVQALADVLRASDDMGYLAPTLYDHIEGLKTNPNCELHTIAGHEVYIVYGNINYGIISYNGWFLSLMGGVPVPDAWNMNIYGGIEVALINELNKHKKCWGLLKNFTEKHTNNCKVYRQWKDEIIFRPEQFGDKQISFEDWIKLEKTKQL